MITFESMPNTEPDPATPRRIHVAVGVIVNRRDEILIALRPEHTHQGGLWEFPGGKVESGETVRQALQRELREELGLEVISVRDLVDIQHDYPDKSVHLDVWWVDQFRGEPQGREGQPICWVGAERLGEFAFPAANQPIIDAVIAALSEQAPASS